MKAKGKLHGHPDMCEGGSEQEQEQEQSTRARASVCVCVGGGGGGTCRGIDLLDLSTGCSRAGYRTARFEI